MNTAGRALGIVVATALLAACGGGGGSTTPVPNPAPSALSVAKKADAKGTITFRYPAHVGHAKPGHAKGAAASSRAPQYINPNTGYVFVFSYYGTPITDPSTGYGYFTTGAFNADGSATVTVPLWSGYYSPDSLSVAEYTDSSLGTLVAYGQNESYTDPTTGAYADGSLNVSAGGVANLQITMAMNVGSIVITSDPVNAIDATILSPSSYTCFLASNNSNVYLFAADASGTFVIGTSGYGGGDVNNPYPGVPLVSLPSQFPLNVGSGSKLTATAPAGYRVIINGDDVEAAFSVTNPLALVSSPFGVPNQVLGYADIGCGG